ncbi:hypothetical protein [Methylovulum psychrotolerans]|uniref:Uncharacterized protein n=1 Tax=Methylovulum psychrotolerans TaxID=1704499 RepID=A0A1Z4BW54_9GAMM|nr:hypothetical protein [Methylovulum psychrotolerans]ASF45449.1 hypothetical protein CEK71_04860 [Methylovulum psychrotolerans]
MKKYEDKLSFMNTIQFSLSTFLFVLGMGFAPASFGYTFVYDTPDKLFGINNLIVGSNDYNVRFIDGAANNIWPSNNFDVTSSSEAVSILRGIAHLLNSAPAETFGTSGLINGIDIVAGEGAGLWMPYGLFNVGTFQAAVANFGKDIHGHNYIAAPDPNSNWAYGVCDGCFSSAGLGADFAGYPQFTFVTVSNASNSIPEPSAINLIAIAFSLLILKQNKIII